jgi:hypothetical protein
MGTATGLSVAAIFLVAGGCTKSMTPGQLNRVQPVSTNQRAGNVYLLRGWIGIFSAGIDNLTRQINDSGVRANVYQDDQWAALAKKIKKEYRGRTNAEPLVLVGHSYGADDVVRIARELDSANIPVDLLVTLDPVTPPLVPGNVMRCVNIYQTHGVWDNLPVLRGVPVAKDQYFSGELVNYNIRGDRKDLLNADTDHFNIEKNEKIHQEIIRQVLATCPSRAQWVAVNFGIQRDPTFNMNGAVPAKATIPPAPAASTARRPVAVRNDTSNKLGN